jgi:cytochrome c553
MKVARWLLFVSLDCKPELARSFPLGFFVACVYAVAAIPALGAGSVSSRTESNDEGVHFFESSVRPLLHEACGKCHGEKTQWANLRVDSRSALLKGGDSGAAIVPGDPDNSLLIQAVRRTGDYEMPPEKPLSADQIAVLEKWVLMGAPWGSEDSVSADSREEQWKTHWAFQPVKNPSPPVVVNQEWTRTPVDQFVLARLEKEMLNPSPEADRRTLIRRVTYDLTGLPPSFEEVEAFVSDASPTAYEKLVERLLESPHYGEHWGRKWLDLARYADTKGYMYGWERGHFVHSANYRDWVIRSFQNDLPYDRFLKLQIAADQMPDADSEDLVAMGFLTVGRRFLGNSHDIIDDRIDTLTRTAIGITIACARCHDHKYDPVPTADYYSLYGVFNNCYENLVETGSGKNSSALQSQEFQKQLESLQNTLEAELQKYRNKIADRMRAKFGEYLIACLQIDDYPDIPFSRILEEDDIYPVYVQRLHAYIERSKGNGSPIFSAWHRFAMLDAAGFQSAAVDVSKELQTLDEEMVLPVVKALFETPPQSMKDVARRYGELFSQIDREWKGLVSSAQNANQPLPVRFDDPQKELLRQVLYGAESPCLVPQESLPSISTYFAVRTELPKIWKFQNEIEELLSRQPAPPAFAVILQDRNAIELPRIFRRGNPQTKGDEVPLQAPFVITGEKREPFKNGSGRLELAEALASSDNPLTARVWVNRIWQGHFGVGIVPTPSDFGVRAPRPEHLELLDWLATRLVESGWSTKAIHREILLSSTYRQSGSGPVDPQVRLRALEIDPENHLIWKMNAHRLSFEEFRDSLFAVTGELNLQVGGKAVQLFNGGEESRRRTIYGFIDRQQLPSVYRVFDFANPDLHIPVRSETTVSQQALFALNHPLVADRARALRAVLFQDDSLSPVDRIRLLFERVLQRTPDKDEIGEAVRFLEAASQNPIPQATPEQLAWQYGVGRVDASDGKIGDFEPLPYFTGSAWQGGPNWPDAKWGWAQLTATGGHPGNTDDRAVVRRWTAPSDLNISIESEVRHEVPKGNGIRGWIISSERGILEQFSLHNNSLKSSLSSLPVRQGETIDFVVDINGNLGFDQFHWVLTIRSQETQVAGEISSQDWNSERDFTTTPGSTLDPWSQLAQVLLLSNEFLFVH